MPLHLRMHLVQEVTWSFVQKQFKRGRTDLLFMRIFASATLPVPRKFERRIIVSSNYLFNNYAFFRNVVGKQLEEAKDINKQLTCLRYQYQSINLTFCNVEKCDWRNCQEKEICCFQRQHADASSTAQPRRVCHSILTILFHWHYSHANGCRKKKQCGFPWFF